MKPQNEANYIKWLLTDQMVDVVAAVGMGRETVGRYKDGDLTVNQAMGRMRVCNHSIIVSLFKVHEVRTKYGDFLRGLPKEKTADLFRDSADIFKRKICDFRNKYAAHIFDWNTKEPISITKGLELLNSITGQDNDQCEAFYNWLYPEGESPLVS